MMGKVILVLAIISTGAPRLDRPPVYFQTLNSMASCQRLANDFKRLLERQSGKYWLVVYFCHQDNAQ